MPMPDWGSCNYRKKCRCWTNFSSAFRHLHLIFQHQVARITPSAAVYGRAGCITFHYQQFGVVHWVMASLLPPPTTAFYKCWNVGLSGIQSVRYRKEQKFRCLNQSGIKGTQSAVPEWSGTGLRYRCRCRRHRPQFRSPAMQLWLRVFRDKGLSYRMILVRSGRERLFWVRINDVAATDKRAGPKRRPAAWLAGGKWPCRCDFVRDGLPFPYRTGCPAASWRNLQLLLHSKCTQPFVMSCITQCLAWSRIREHIVDRS